jgi:tetratricopeptide (TPR) repeat protein
MQRPNMPLVGGIFMGNTRSSNRICNRPKHYSEPPRTTGTFEPCWPSVIAMHGKTRIVKQKSVFRKRLSPGNNAARYYLAGLSDDSEAIPLYYAAAKEGHPLAQKELGDRFAEGNGVDQDTAEAAKWYKRAAEQGDPEAQGKLGACYTDGWVIPTRYIETTQGYRNRQAAKWYRKAAEQGVPEAQRRIAHCYAAGIGVAQNEIEAAKWYRKYGAYEAVGDLYAKIGEKTKAAKAYRKAGVRGRITRKIHALGPKDSW